MTRPRGVEMSIVPIVPIEWKDGDDIPAEVAGQSQPVPVLFWLLEYCPRQLVAVAVPIAYLLLP